MIGQLSSRALFFYGLVAVAIYVSSIFLIPRGSLISVLNGVFLGLTAGVCIVFAPLIWRAIKDNTFDRVSQLTTGMVLNWVAFFLLRSNNAWNRANNTISASANNALQPLALYIAICAAILHITAPGMVDTKLVYNRRLLGWAAFIGLLIALYSISLQVAGTPPETAPMKLPHVWTPLELYR